MKRLRELAPSLELFYERLEPLVRRGKLGPSSGSCRRRSAATTSGSRRRSALRRGRHCIEFRHASWFAPDVMALLREHGVALVIGDRPEVRAFQTHELDRGLGVRPLPPRHTRPQGQLLGVELREWAERIRSWPVSEVFVYFNNDWEGFAPRNGLRLRELLEAPTRD